jgi:hypothetical protein
MFAGMVGITAISFFMVIAMMMGVMGR